MTGKKSFPYIIKRVHMSNGAAYGQVINIALADTVDDCGAQCRQEKGDGWSWNSETNKCTTFKPVFFKGTTTAGQNCVSGRVPEIPSIHRGFWYGQVSEGDQGANLTDNLSELGEFWYFAFPGDYGPQCCCPDVTVTGCTFTSPPNSLNTCDTLFPGNRWETTMSGPTEALGSLGMTGFSAAYADHQDLQWRVDANGAQNGSPDYYFMPTRDTWIQKVVSFGPSQNFSSDDTFNTTSLGTQCGDRFIAPYGPIASHSSETHTPRPFIGICPGPNGQPGKALTATSAKGAILTIGGNGYWTAGMLAYLAKDIQAGAFNQWDGLCLDIENISDPRWDAGTNPASGYHAPGQRMNAWTRDNISEFVFYLGLVLASIQGKLDADYMAQHCENMTWGGWKGEKNQRGISIITGQFGIYGCGGGCKNSPNSILPWATGPGSANADSKPPNTPVDLLWWGQCDCSSPPGCTDAMQTRIPKKNAECPQPANLNIQEPLCSETGGLWGKGTVNRAAAIGKPWNDNDMHCLDPYWGDCPGYEEIVLKCLDYWVPQAYSVLNGNMPCDDCDPAADAWKASLSQRGIAHGDQDGSQIKGNPPPVTPITDYWCQSELAGGKRPCKSLAEAREYDVPLEKAGLGWRYFLKPNSGVKILWGLSTNSTGSQAGNKTWGPNYTGGGPAENYAPDGGKKFGELFGGDRLVEAIWGSNDAVDMQAALGLTGNQPDGANTVDGAILWVARAPTQQNPNNGIFSGLACLPQGDSLCPGSDTPGCCPSS